MSQLEIYKRAAKYLGSMSPINSISDVNSEYVVNFNSSYDDSYELTLTDLSLDSFSDIRALELVKNKPIELFEYGYKYPDDCLEFRRVLSGSQIDNRFTQVNFLVRTISGQKLIMTNKKEAEGEFISSLVGLSSFNRFSRRCLALRLALDSGSLIMGQGFETLIGSLTQRYEQMKAAATALDGRENDNPEPDRVSSEFILAKSGVDEIEVL